MSDLVKIVALDGEINFDHDKLLKYSNTYKTLNSGDWLETHTKTLQVDFTIQEINCAKILLADVSTIVKYDVLDYIDKCLRFLDYLMLTPRAIIYIAIKIFRKKQSVTFMFKYSGKESSLIESIFDDLMKLDMTFNNNKFIFPMKRDHWELYAKWLIYYYRDLNCHTNDVGLMSSLSQSEKPRIHVIIPPDHLLQVYRDLGEAGNANNQEMPYIIQSVDLKYYNYLLFIKTLHTRIGIRYYDSDYGSNRAVLTVSNHTFYYSKIVDHEIKTIWLHDEDKNIIKEIQLEMNKEYSIDPSDACYVSFPTTSYVKYIDTL